MEPVAVGGYVASTAVLRSPGRRSASRRERAAAEAMIRDGIIEFQRHTLANWEVLAQIHADLLRAGAPAATRVALPDAVHYRKLRYVDTRGIFTTPHFATLPPASRTAILNLEPEIRNANLEIDAAVDIAAQDDPTRLLHVTAFLMRKAQYLGVRRFAGIELRRIREPKASPWQRMRAAFGKDAELVRMDAVEGWQPPYKAMRDARKAEEANLPDRKDILYRPLTPDQPR